MPQHLAWPPALVYDPAGRASFATVEQDSPAEIQQTTAVLCELRPGDLPWNPQLGIPDPQATVDPVRTAQEIEAAIRANDPRAAYTVTVDGDPDQRVLRLGARA